MPKKSSKDAQGCPVPQTFDLWARRKIGDSLMQGHQDKTQRDWAGYITEEAANKRFHLVGTVTPGAVLDKLQACGLPIETAPAAIPRPPGEGELFRLRKIRKETPVMTTTDIHVHPVPVVTVSAPEPTPLPAPAPSADFEESLAQVEAALVACWTDPNMTDQEARACTINHLPEDSRCAVHAVLLTQEGCPFCANAVNALTAEGVKFETLDVAAGRGLDIAERAGVDEVPHLLLVNCTDEIMAELDLPEAKGADAQLTVTPKPA